jgi:dTDP-4-amino-4,6-dideoxygalactose transaminase
MMQIMAHHQLKVVAVDLPESALDTTAPVVAVDCDAIREAVTARTVAVLVVHPFGMISATEKDMAWIQELASKHKLDVLEDCAECFTGLEPECYLGSPHADVSFFSFGLIKTATALGGGVAVFRDESVVQSMDRLHFSLYRQQVLGNTWSGDQEHASIHDAIVATVHLDCLRVRVSGWIWMRSLHRC